jgi:NAD(P)-dependent dehydrogenase (short-subunit alcohol dehydrogenase family)
MTKVALVTGGGRGIGAGIARALAGDGWDVVVGARTRDQVNAVAEEIGGRAVELDVRSKESIDRAVAEAGDVELLVANAGIGGGEQSAWEVDPADWWRVFEVNVRGVQLSCRAVIPGMIERGSAGRGGAGRPGGRIVITGSGASYLPGAAGNTAYAASKAAVGRFAEGLAQQLRPHGIPVFLFSPGLVKTEMTSSFGDDAPWTPPELAPELVRVLASGRADALAGRYLHAEHDDIDDLIARADEIRERDLNAIRLQR